MHIWGDACTQVAVRSFALSCVSMMCHIYMHLFSCLPKELQVGSKARSADGHPSLWPRAAVHRQRQPRPLPSSCQASSREQARHSVPAAQQCIAVPPCSVCMLCSVLWRLMCGGREEHTCGVGRCRGSSRVSGCALHRSPSSMGEEVTCNGQRVVKDQTKFCW